MSEGIPAWVIGIALFGVGMGAGISVEKKLSSKEHEPRQCTANINEMRIDFTRNGFWCCDEEDCCQINLTTCLGNRYHLKDENGR